MGEASRAGDSRFESWVRHITTGGKACKSNTPHTWGTPKMRMVDPRVRGKRDAEWDCLAAKSSMAPHTPCKL